MPILAPRPKSPLDYKNTPSPDAAGLVSFLLPGLGQLWGGERRKGVLFLAAHLLNVLALCCIVFSHWILKSLDAFGQANAMKVNQQLSQSFTDLGFGSPTSVIVTLLLLSFAFFAARDAFDHSAQKRRQAIYHDYVLALPEATSGSYIFHVSFLLACLVMAFFFLIPPAPRSQITDIEFVQNEENTKEKPITNKRAEKSSRAAGKHDPTRPTEKASAQKASASSKNSQAESKPEPKPEPKSGPKPPSKVAPAKSAAEAAKPVAEPAKPVESAKPKAVAPAADIAPRPQPQPLARVQSNTLPQPAALLPTAAAPKPTLPAITPIISSLPAVAQNPLLPPLAVGKSPSLAPTPVALTRMAMAVPGPAMPHSPGKAAAAESAGVPAPIAVTSSQSGGTKGGASQPTPVAVRGSSADPGATGVAGPGHNAPAPSRGTRNGPSPGTSFGTAGPVLHLGPGSGANNNPANDNTARAGNSDDVAPEANWPPYMADLQRKIKRCWFPPHDVETKRVKVIFTLLTSGELSNLRLVRSSGSTIADKAALKAVEDAAPFRHLPEHAPASVDIEFTFDYNVFGGAGYSH